MKKRVSIYIDEFVWGDLKELAWRSRQSASAYLEELISGKRSEARVPVHPVAKIVVETDATMPPNRVELRHEGKAVGAIENIGDDTDVIAKAQAKLDKVRRDKGIPKWSGGYSKDKQLGKKGM